jgi:hypothetical protein
MDGLNQLNDYKGAALSRVMKDTGLELAFILGQQKGRWFYRVPLFVEQLR